MTDNTAQQDQLDFEKECRSGIDVWVRKNLGGVVKEVTRLERWRPQWKVVYTVDGQPGTVLFRGNRSIAGKNELRFEMDVMQVLEAQGVKIPHIYG